MKASSLTGRRCQFLEEFPQTTFWVISSSVALHRQKLSCRDSGGQSNHGPPARCSKTGSLLADAVVHLGIRSSSAVRPLIRLADIDCVPD